MQRPRILRFWHEGLRREHRQRLQPGHAKLKKVLAPFPSKTVVIEDTPARGHLAESPSSILMKLMWLARLARPDMLQVTAWLADLHHWIVLWCWFLWGWWSCLLYVWRLDSVEWPRHSFPIAWMSKIHNGSWNSGNGHHTLWWWGTTGRIVLWSFQRSVGLLNREDKEATAKVVSAGYSERLRHMKRTHCINLGSHKEELDKEGWHVHQGAS